MFLWLTSLLLVTVQICKASDSAERCDNFTDLNLNHAIIGTSIKVRLLLYTRGHVNCGVLMSHTNMSAHPQFDLSRPTTFVIHGFRPTGSPPMWLHNITEILLARKDMNLIVVDWNHGATNVNYFKVVEHTHKAAENLTAFVKKMQEGGASMSSIHMIGVSLGAHISGFVGASMNGAIGRITALDPAGPMFTGKPLDQRLDSSDAQFVDALHTDIDSLGFREPVGHIDFYANGGTDQPGCPKSILGGGAYFKCDHQRSVLLYLDSVKGTCSTRVFPCTSYKDFLDGKCLSCERFGAAGCPVFGYDVILWKYILLRLGETKTYFTTNPHTPFCMTNYEVSVLVWNQDARWGYITVQLHGDGGKAVATIDHTASEFRKFTETKLFAHFDKDIQSVKTMTLKFSTGNVLKPKYKLRILRVRLTHLERNERSLCRYDFVLEEKREVTFRLIPCDPSNF